MGEERGGGGVEDDFSGVEISIARGVEEIVRGLTTVTSLFFFIFFLNPLIVVSIGATRHKGAHPTVLGTRDCQASEAHVVQNLQLQSIRLPSS